MVRIVNLELELPADLRRFRLPKAVHKRLQQLLDRQDRGDALTKQERAEAEGLVNLSEMLTLLQMRVGRPVRRQGGHGR